MPRRKKAYVGPGKTLVNGGRFDPTVDANEEEPVTTVPAVDVDIDDIRKKVAAYIQNFDELAQLGDRDQFIKDLADVCAWARTLHLDLLTKGAHTKPDEWTTQILANGIASVLQRHGLTAAISEYEDRNHDEILQSLYLRLIPGLGRIAGCLIPRDVKHLALRAKRIKLEGGAVTPPDQAQVEGSQGATGPNDVKCEYAQLEALIQAYRELDPELQAHPTGNETIERLRIAVIQKLGVNNLAAETIKRDIEQVRSILRLIQNGTIPPPGERRERQGLSERTRLEMATGKAAVARAEALLKRTD